MQIALIGYGKMGKAIEKIATNRGHNISARIDADPTDLKQLGGAHHDVAIEFSVPEKASQNILKCIDFKIPVLSGTTGWVKAKPEVDQYCKSKDGTFFYASNYSLGVNLFFKLNEQLAQMMGRYKDYEVILEEIHHTQKKDAPSGTAITLAEGILKHYPDKSDWTRSTNATEKEIKIESKRIDPYPGQHTVKYHSVTDDIEIRHTAHSREGFALGAVLVAEWLPAQKGVLSMDDFLKF